MDSKQIAEAMRLKLPVRYNGITYQQITEYILWYDTAGTRRTSVSLLDKNSHSITRAPADRVELVAQEGGTDEQYHQRDPARELFIPNEGTAYLLDLLSRMTDENSVSTKDNGVTQTVEARQGVALNALVEVKPRIQLQPFRTFLEVPQPESEFLLRVDPNEGIGFFEADGGVWKLEAKRNIADYFEKNLKDLIEAGKVVVMK